MPTNHVVQYKLHTICYADIVLSVLANLITLDQCVSNANYDSSGS